MGFIDPVTAYIRWGTATIPAGQTTITVTHGASFTPNKIIPNRTDLPITINNVSNTTFDLSIPEQATDIDIEWMAGKNKNYVLVFDGVNDYVNVPDTDSLDTGNLMTVSFWVNSSITDDIGVITKFTGGGQPSASWAFLEYSDGISFIVEETDGGTSNTSHISIIGGWHHIVGVADGTELILYKDGISQATIAYDGTIQQSATSIKIGARSNVGTGNAEYFYTGTIDEVRIWNRALSASEVTALYNGNASRDGLVLEYLFQEASGTTATDTSGSGNQGTISGATYLETEVE